MALRASASSLFTDKTHSLQNKLRGNDVNLVGKRKQLHVLTDHLGSLLVNTTKGTT